MPNSETYFLLIYIFGQQLGNKLFHVFCDYEQKLITTVDSMLILNYLFSLTRPSHCRIFAEASEG